MLGSFSDIKKLLPGIILGLIFVGAFSIGLYGFSASDSSAPNPLPNQSSNAPTSTDTASPNPGEVVSPEQPALTSEPTAPVVTEPEVTVEITPAIQPIVSAEEHQKGAKTETEKESKESKEHLDREDNDD